MAGRKSFSFSFTTCSASAGLLNKMRLKIWSKSRRKSKRSWKKRSCGIRFIFTFILHLLCARFSRFGPGECFFEPAGLAKLFRPSKGRCVEHSGAPLRGFESHRRIGENGSFMHMAQDGCAVVRWWLPAGWPLTFGLRAFKAGCHLLSVAVHASYIEPPEIRSGDCRHGST